MKSVDSGFDSILIEERSSKGIVIDNKGNTPNPNGETRQNEDLQIYREMVKNDPIISSAFDATVDVALYAGYDFVPREPKFEKKAKEMALKFEYEYQFSDVLENLLYCMLYYGDAYLEIRKMPKIELYSLESPEITIDFNEKGKINGFKQKSGATEIKWNPNEVIHLPLKRIGSTVYSYKMLEPIAVEYTSNVYAREHLKQIFKNAPPKMIYSLMNASKEQRQMFIQNLRLAKTNPAIDLVAMGEVKTQEIGVKIYKELLDVLDKFRADMLAVTRVPPLWLGYIGEGADRGNAEAQIFGFETRIRKIQRKLEIKINAELLPRLGIRNMFFKFNPFSLKDEKSVLQNAEMMMNLGVKRAKIAEYLSIRGITVSEEDINELEQKNDNDLDPSRQRMNKQTDDTNSYINQKGSSDAGGEKLEEMSVRSIVELQDEVDQYGEYLRSLHE